MGAKESGPLKLDGNRSTRSTRRTAEGAEHCSPGRAPNARAPLLSIHAFKVFEVSRRDRCAALRALWSVPALSASIGSVEFQRL